MKTVCTVVVQVIFSLCFHPHKPLLWSRSRVLVVRRRWWWWWVEFVNFFFLVLAKRLIRASCTVGAGIINNCFSLSTPPSSPSFQIFTKRWCTSKHWCYSFWRGLRRLLFSRSRSPGSPQNLAEALWFSPSQGMFILKGMELFLLCFVNLVFLLGIENFVVGICFAAYLLISMNLCS